MNPLTEFVEFEKIEIPEPKRYQLQAFAVYRAVEDYIKGNSPALDIRDEAYYYRRWNKMILNELKQRRLTWLVNNIKRIGREMQDRLYDKKDLTLTFLFLYYYSKHIDLSAIKEVIVKTAVEKFSNRQYEKDKAFVLEICKEVKINGIEDFFQISDDGTSLLYKYIVDKQFISPFFYIRLADKVSANNIAKQNNNYKKFTKISLAIKKLLTN